MRTHARERRWADILRDETCFYVEPFVVDAILAGDESMGDAARRAGYPSDYAAEKDRRGLEAFLKRAAGKLCKDLPYNISESSFDELSAMVRTRVFEAIGQYKPGKWKGESFSPWGFEAFLYNFPIKRALTDFLREMRMSSGVRLEQPSAHDGNLTVLDSLESGGHIATPSELPFDVIEVAFEQALLSALKDSPGKTEYMLYNACHMTIDEIAKQVGDNVSACYRRLCLASENVIESLQERIAFLLGTDTETARVEILGYLCGNDAKYRMLLDDSMLAAYHSLIDGDDKNQDAA